MEGHLHSTEKLPIYKKAVVTEWGLQDRSKRYINELLIELITIILVIVEGNLVS